MWQISQLSERARSCPASAGSSSTSGIFSTTWEPLPPHVYFTLSWHLERACIFNHRSTSREVTQGTPRGSRSALCSSSPKPRPTRAASRCCITSWRYTKWLAAAITYFSLSLSVMNWSNYPLLGFFLQRKQRRTTRSCWHCQMISRSVKKQRGIIILSHLL